MFWMMNITIQYILKKSQKEGLIILFYITIVGSAEESKCH